MSDARQIFIGRQPILDREDRIVAYELLFRDSAEAQTAVIQEQSLAATRVMANTFAALGTDAVLGPYTGFFNVNREVLLGDLVEALPRDRVTIEVLEDIAPDREVVERCRELQQRGVSLALDDYLVNDPRDTLLDFVDCVKVDLLGVEDRHLPQLTRRLRRYPIRLLAEKVETREQLERCLDLGFDLFQGYYFARPTVLSGARIDPARAILLRLLQQLSREADAEELSETFKQHVNLGVNLLRLVNSAAMGRRHKVAAVRDALNYLGRRHLRRWLNILLYAGNDALGLDSPLLHTAAKRGRLMELLLRSTLSRDGVSEKEDSAFLVGMLSLVDALLGRPKAEIVAELNLEDELVAALLDHEGHLGTLLALAEGLERGDFAAVADLSRELGVGAEETTRAELAASQWVCDLGQDLGDDG